MKHIMGTVLNAGLLLIYIVVSTVVFVMCVIRNSVIRAIL